MYLEILTWLWSKVYKSKSATSVKPVRSPSVQWNKTGGLLLCPTGTSEIDANRTEFNSSRNSKIERHKIWKLWIIDD